MDFYDEDIVEITSKGIMLEKEGKRYFIDFEVCDKKFKESYPEATFKCIGERDINAPVPFFRFYTTPETMLYFKKSNCLVEFFKAFKGTSCIRRFFRLHYLLIGYNWLTFDLC